MSQYNKTIISSLTLAFLMAVLVMSNVYAAAPTGTITQAPNTCVLKSDLLADEVTGLTGAGSPGSGGGIAGGTTLGSAATGAATPYLQAPSYGILCMYGLIKQITNIIWLLVGLLSIAAILYAAFLFMTSQSVPAKLGEARTVLMFAIIGILVAATAKFLPNLVLSFMGVGGGI